MTRQEMTKIAFREYPKLPKHDEKYHVQSLLRNAFLHGLKLGTFLEEKKKVKNKNALQIAC